VSRYDIQDDNSISIENRFIKNVEQKQKEIKTKIYFAHKVMIKFHSSQTEKKDTKSSLPPGYFSLIVTKEKIIMNNE
jgi:hypothetical protein